MSLFDSQDPLDDEPTKACRSCGAPIKWIRTQDKDKPAPVDAKPIRLYQTTSVRSQGTPVAKIVRAWMPHFATCPDAAEFRRV